MKWIAFYRFDFWLPNEQIGTKSLLQIGMSFEIFKIYSQLIVSKQIIFGNISD